MKLKNIEMSIYLNTLRGISDKVTGKLGYSVARNMRKLASELTEFEKTKNEYIFTHGLADENGGYSIEQNTDEYKEFLEFIQEYANIEHEVDIFVVDEEELMKSELTANEMLALDFMISKN